MSIKFHLPLSGFVAIVMSDVGCTAIVGRPDLTPTTTDTGGIGGHAGDSALTNHGGVASIPLAGHAGSLSSIGAGGTGERGAGGASIAVAGRAGAETFNSAGRIGDAGAAGLVSSNGGEVSAGANGSAGATIGPTIATLGNCESLTATCQSESCCTSILVPGGPFKMGRSTEQSGNDYYADADPIYANETPEHDATVAGFWLDKYEVTIGRFRNFVKSYDSWVKAGNPKSDAGSYSKVADMGWGRSWTKAASDLPLDSDTLKSNLKYDKTYCNWTDDEISAEADAFPINCVSWYEALAFCIWDGGRLPTEAEWEYAAAGGMRNQLFPWGNQSPSKSRANYMGSDNSPKVVVGSKGALGEGYFTHLDLAGSVWEWVFDWYSDTFYGSALSPRRCDNCANTTRDVYRVSRGGSWYGDGASLRATYRLYNMPVKRFYFVGFRCARSE